ncbi:hypothetical protein BDF22DRAFT_702129 [Syncephalis plumigaleata]|nr:hypothetical protein BDF22DRAFT_702129 [Syncephalis plumigaleata]
MPAHSIIHVAIDGDMSTSGSPADPLFFIHHSFVDLQWATWQSMSKENAMAFGGKKRDGTNAQLTDKLTPFDVTVRDVMDTRDLCYVYDRLAGNNKLSKRRITRRQQQQRPSLLQGILSSVNSVVKQVASEITHEFSDYTVDLSDTKPSAAFVNEVLGRTKRRDTAEIKNDDPVYVNGLRTSKPFLARRSVNLPGYVSPSDLINHPNALADAAKDRKQVSVMRGVTSDNRVDVDKLTTSIKNTLAALDVIIAQKLTVPNKS